MTDLTVRRRTTARVLPVRPDGRVLLLHGWDPLKPDTTYWFTIGGGVENGETVADAACRELREEVGIELPPVELGTPLATNTIEFEYGGSRIIQAQTFYAVAVDRVDVTFANQEEIEQQTISEHGWWYGDDLEATGLAAHVTIPALLRQATDAITLRRAS
ncbi:MULTISPECIES: NUDIX hydrolase [Kribbella]|uniref:Nudix hydrolase domain-containing protein n=1 Tax=Kribbella karoonensis TaxID=324851 RepID=A0ABN2EEM3_9ACTN